MVTEDYVSFETAKLLKEKGFDDEYTNAFYDKNGELYFIELLSDFSSHPDNDTDLAASTLYVAMKWLREVHKLVICAEIGNENFKGNNDYSNPDRWYWFFDITNEKGVVIDTESDFISNEYTTYEQACEAGIKYCLENLI